MKLKDEILTWEKFKKKLPSESIEEEEENFFMVKTNKQIEIEEEIKKRKNGT
jgi:hypothetical protein